MPIAIDASTLQFAMGIVLFVLGVVCLIAGLRLILTREYSQGMKELVAQSAKVGRRGVSEHSVAPVIDATSRLIESVATLVRTAFGMGAFLCMLGLALCCFGAWIIGLTLP
ncbi:MAG: hypothetical protein ACOYEW_01700 [Anaerolineae bacterium]|jgi:DMSO/TMAO reductase YedYZ heme-binding membrane subunit